MNARDREIGTTNPTLPLEIEAVQKIIDRGGAEPGAASIRQMNNMVNALEQAFDMSFARMEFGIPGLPVHPLAIAAEAEAMKQGVAHVYAPFEGLPALKDEASLFVKNFMGLDLPPTSCLPMVGAMHGCFSCLMVAGRLNRNRRTVLLLEPGFPVNRLQLRVLGLECATLDFYDHRGDRLIEAVQERVKRGDICAILWSSPNNPSWIVLQEPELQGLARICDEHHVLAIEDLAYFGMDTRVDYFEPGRPPYQPTILRYTDRAVCVVSSSKIFSYAGQRICMVYVPQRLMEMDTPDLAVFHGTPLVGQALLHGTLYPTAASVPQTPQYGLLALLRAANSGDRSVFTSAAEYTRRARLMKAMFLDNGFSLVYDNDMGAPLADGFYFTVAYPGFDDGAVLLKEMLRYGVSAITLETTGSRRVEGLRACVSLMGESQLAALEERLELFHRDH